MVHELPRAIVEAFGPETDSAHIVSEARIGTGTGAATGGVTRLEVELAGRGGGAVRRVTLLRKRLAPLTSGRHASGASEPRHWAYWRREAEAYSAGILPAGPGLRAPRCYGVVDDELYLEEVRGEQPSLERAAQALAGWQRPWDPEHDRPWLCVDQLAARVAVSDLDWAAVDADPRMEAVWGRRTELLARLAELPKVLSHGDYGLGNLLDDGRDVVALDWATVGWEPVGFDLAHLALSVGEDPSDAYVDATSTMDPALVTCGFTIAVALVGSSRVHWMAAARREPPDWYCDFVWRHRPEGFD